MTIKTLCQPGPKMSRERSDVGSVVQKTLLNLRSYMVCEAVWCVLDIWTNGEASYIHILVCFLIAVSTY